MFDREKLSRVAEHSGLTKGELAFVLGVTRATVYTWLDGTTPTKYIVVFIDRALDRLSLAIEKGVLPLSDNLSRESRKARIEKMKAGLENLR